MGKDEENSVTKDFCDDCHRLVPLEELEDCMYCFGQFCWGCFQDHEIYCATEHCQLCGAELEVDPPCPTCGINLCDNCFKDHAEPCKQKHELGRIQRFITEWT